MLLVCALLIASLFVVFFAYICGFLRRATIGVPSHCNWPMSIRSATPALAAALLFGASTPLARP
ncbi:hypothetical protein [Arthrobacter methylotrophus]|uniref:hypothetical protein n=1 Tax=Arthrobacter methylotrophus TaxID=121291 RepID=UPI0031E93E40